LILEASPNLYIDPGCATEIPASRLQRREPLGT
jgi:hypothetical protein